MSRNWLARGLASHRKSLQGMCTLTATLGALGCTAGARPQPATSPVARLGAQPTTCEVPRSSFRAIGNEARTGSGVALGSGGRGPLQNHTLALVADVDGL